MIVLHEVAPQSVPSILSSGVKCMPRGEKGDDPSIAATDHLLDSYRPPYLVEQGVKREGNIYGYLVQDTDVVDITDGSFIPIDEFIRRSERAVLQLRINSSRCYVSNLDLFDRLMTAIQNNAAADELKVMAQHYWQSLVTLSDYQPGSIGRPEVMIPYDIPPDAIKQLS